MPSAIQQSMLGIALAVFVLLPLLALVADRLRERVTLVRTEDRLVLQNREVALRLDVLILLLSLFFLGLAFTFQVPAAVAITALSAFPSGWRLAESKRSLRFIFDREGDAVWRDNQRVCGLSAIESLEVRPSFGKAVLGLRYRSPGGRGRLRRELLYRARPVQVAELHAAVADFLRTRAPQVESEHAVTGDRGGG